MKVTFLGTGTSQGVPVIGCTCSVCLSLDYRDKRLRTSVHIQSGELSLVIDTGPDFRQQMLRERIGTLHAVLMTHTHKDHTAGLDDVRAYNYKQQTDMPVYGTRTVHQHLQTEFYYAFEKIRYPGIPQLKLVEIDEQPFTIENLTVTPLPVSHLHMPVTGFRIGRFSYITDAKDIPASTMKRLEGTDTLVLNALQREKHISHFNLEEAIAMAGRIGARQTFLVHLSHKMGLHQQVEKELPTGVALAYDGLSIEA